MQNLWLKTGAPGTAPGGLRLLLLTSATQTGPGRIWKELFQGPGKRSEGPSRPSGTPSLPTVLKGTPSQLWAQGGARLTSTRKEKEEGKSLWHLGTPPPPPLA